MVVTSCSKSGVLHVSFNQDCTCVALGSQQGVHIYNVDTHKLCYRHAIGAVSIVEMLFCTSLVGFVGAGEQPALTPRKLTVMNTSASRIIQELTYPTSVLAVRMNRQRLVVVTARRVHIYSMSNLACVRVIDTEDNPKGCCALTCCHDPNLLALPASSTTGAVRIYDLSQDGGNVLSEVQAHQAPLVALAWSPDGSLLATASSKGTVVRVHRMPAAARSHSFRRGSTSATIQSLAFSPSPHHHPQQQQQGPHGGVQLLVAASSRGTVHVFRLEDPEPPGVVSRPASAAAGLLSAVVRYSVGDMVEPARNIATIRLPQSVGTVTCAFRQTPPPPPPPPPPPLTGPSQLLMLQPQEGDLALIGAVGTAPASPASRPLGGEGGGGSGDAGEAVGPAGQMVASGSNDPRVVIMVATQEGLLYEYSLTDLRNPQGPKCNLDGEWSMLGSGSVLG